MSLDAMLASGEGEARGWLLQVVSRETSQDHARGPGVPQLHAVCPCGQSMMCLSPDGDRPAYWLTWDQVLAGITAHIRQCHASGPPAA